MAGIGSEFSESIEYIERNILNIDFERNLDKYVCHMKNDSTPDKLGDDMFSLVENIIEVIEKNAFSSDYSKNILSILLYLCNGIEYMSTEQVINVYDKCLELIRSASKDQSCSEKKCADEIWSTFLPKVMEILEGKTNFVHCGSRTTGRAYKTFVINSICEIKLNPRLLIPLSVMWDDVTLSDEEHQQVVKTLCAALGRITIEPTLLPPFINQLLNLTRKRHSIFVILKLRDFLVKKLYSKVSNEAQTDDIEDSYVMDLAKAEAVIIYHFEECAKNSRSLVTDLIKLIRSIQSLPQNCLDPFILALLLSLSNISMYESELIRLIKTIIMNCFTEMERKHDSGWIRQQETQSCDVENVFKVLIKSKVGSKEKVLKGLVNTSFALLCTVPSPKISQSVVDKTRRTGREMIILLIKNQRQVSKEVITRLCESLCSGDLNFQYTDTLYQICEMAIFSALEQIKALENLISSMHRLPYQMIQRIIIAVLPVVKLKTSFRDLLLLSLRKMLFCNDVHVKQAAVFGFLRLLKLLRLEQLISSFSQNSLNQLMGPSLFTQMIVEVHSSQPQQHNASQTSSNKNEAVCLEVLGVLRRCLSQPHVVRSALYKGSIDCVSMNNELCLGILELLLEHFRQFYVHDTDILPPVHFEKVAILSERSEYILQEPVSELILVLSQLINCAKPNPEQEIDSTMSSNIENAANKLDSLVDRFIKCNVDTLQLSEDSLDVSYRKQVLMQVLGIYEALMTYKLYALDLDSTIENNNALLNLFKQHHVLMEFINTLPKSKSKKPDEPTQKTQQSKKQDEKLAGLSVKLPITILDLRTLNKYLELLFKDDMSFMSSEICDNRKGDKRRLYVYILTTTLHVLQNPGERKSSDLFKHVCALSKLMYEDVLPEQNYERVKSLDHKISLLCLNIFHVMFNIIINHYDSQLAKYLFAVTGKPVESGIKKQIMPLLKIYHLLISNDLEKLETISEENEADEYGEICSTLEICWNTLANITTKLDKIDSIKTWVVEICETTKITSKLMSKQILNLMLTLTMRDEGDISILIDMTLQLGRLYDTIVQTQEEKISTKLLIINKNTKGLVLPIVCDYLIKCINHIEWFLIRLKSYYNLLNLYRADDVQELKEREKQMIQLSTLLCTIVKHLANLSLPIEATQYPLRVIIRTYTMLNNITKYYQKNTLTCYKDARFNCLVASVGGQLSKQVGEFIYETEQTRNNQKFINQLVPRVILEQENFNKLVLILSNKTKDTSLSNSLKMIETRDYKLDVKQIRQIVQKNEEAALQDDTTLQEDTSSPPPSKRSRLDSGSSDSNANLSNSY